MRLFYVTSRSSLFFTIHGSGFLFSVYAKEETLACLGCRMQESPSSRFSHVTRKIRTLAFDIMQVVWREVEEEVDQDNVADRHW